MCNKIVFTTLCQKHQIRMYVQNVFFLRREKCAYDLRMLTL